MYDGNFVWRISPLYMIDDVTMDMIALTRTGFRIFFFLLLEDTPKGLLMMKDAYTQARGYKS